jgi:hypothetical protein
VEIAPQEGQVHPSPPSHAGGSVTFDLVGMTAAVFRQKTATRLVLTVYYANLFLVLETTFW